MWDLGKFYDDLEHSNFERMLTCGTLLNFVTTWNTLFLKYCLHVGPILDYDFFQSLWHQKMAWNRERSAIVPTVMTKIFLSLNLLRSEIL
jgi:hypothetical protein